MPYQKVRRSSSCEITYVEQLNWIKCSPLRLLGKNALHCG